MHAPGEPASPIDDGLMTVFPAPHSYTGEDVVELGVHGGAFVAEAVCAALVEAGARPAEPGEFTERAVCNGKLDLLRAEAIADLIDARSSASHRAAMRQLSGALSAKLSVLREAVIELEALLAYDIDFPEEDDGVMPRARVLAACDQLLPPLDALLATVPAALLAQDGATVVLAGAPNAGKSSLLNALIGESRVIVSDVPGTTRDAVEVLLDHEPWPLRLVDTAGLRTSEDPLERLGIEVSERYLLRAHVVVACGDSPETLRRTVSAIRELTPAPIVGARTKRDLVAERENYGDLSCDVVPISALRGEGLSALLGAVTAAVARPHRTVDPETPMISRARHRAALHSARADLSAFREAWTTQAVPATVAAVHVRAAEAALGELIGTVDVEEVFARVFSTFCVGK